MSAKSNSNGNGNAGATVVQVVSGSAGAPGRTIQVRARVKMIGAVDWIQCDPSGQQIP